MIYLKELDLYIDKITTEQYLKYLEYVDDNSIDNIEKKYLIIKTLTGLSMDRIQEINTWDVDNIYCELYLYILTVEEKFAVVCEDGLGIKPVKQEKSIFDDYDKENGYEDFEEKLTESQKRVQMINFFIRYMSTNHKLSYDGFMKSDLSALLDNINYNFKYDREHKK